MRNTRSSGCIVCLLSTHQKRYTLRAHASNTHGDFNSFTGRALYLYGAIEHAANAHTCTHLTRSRASPPLTCPLSVAAPNAHIVRHSMHICTYVRTQIPPTHLLDARAFSRADNASPSDHATQTHARQRAHGEKLLSQTLWRQPTSTYVGLDDDDDDNNSSMLLQQQQRQQQQQHRPYGNNIIEACTIALFGFCCVRFYYSIYILILYICTTLYLYM